MARHLAFGSVLGAWLLGLGACTGGDDGGNPAACPAVQSAPLYFGDDHPRELELSAGERAAIGVVEPTPAIALCTGVLIAPRWVLTAAHCDVGENLTFRASLPNARRVAAISTTLHPTVDAMLLELEADPSLDLLEPIAIWDGVIDESWIGDHLTLAGVGETEDGTFGTLQFVDEPVIAVNETEIGVHGMGRSGACSGDSGGPLLTAASDGKPRVVGVLDRGSTDCLGLDVYVRADQLRSWMTEAIGMDMCSPSGARLHPVAR